jgi:hypothetical protein
LKQRDETAVPAAVRKAVDRGWSVIPVRQDKTPLLSGWKRYQTKRATLEEIEQWQAEFSPDAWAVVTGEVSGVIVLDFDGEAGRKTLKKLALDPHVRTGSGGFHAYFEHPGWRVSTLNGKAKRELGGGYPGVDVRADGGYAVFWGRNSSGPYQRLRQRSPDNLDLLPKELRRFLGLNGLDLKGVRDAARTEDQRAGCAADGLIADPRGDLAFKDVGSSRPRCSGCGEAGNCPCGRVHRLARIVPASDHRRRGK